MGVVQHLHEKGIHPVSSKEDIQSLLPHIKAATVRVGAANDFFLILDWSIPDFRSQPWIFVTSDATDVTQLVIAEFGAEPQTGPR